MADTCNSCAKPIIWAITENKRRMPVDGTPAARGNVRLTYANGRVAPTAVVVPVGSEPTLYTSHFATCPNADRFRKTKKKRAVARSIFRDALREMGDERDPEDLFDR